MGRRGAGNPGTAGRAPSGRSDPGAVIRGPRAAGSDERGWRPGARALPPAAEPAGARLGRGAAAGHGLGLGLGRRGRRRHAACADNERHLPPRLRRLVCSAWSCVTAANCVAEEQREDGRRAYLHPSPRPPRSPIPCGHVG